MMEWAICITMLDQKLRYRIWAFRASFNGKLT